MPLSHPSLRELSDHDVSWRVRQPVDEDGLHALAQGERAEILELALRLMGAARTINPDVPVVKRLRSRGLRRCHVRRPGCACDGQRDACHSAGMVLFQPALSQAQWHAEVEKMRTAYKAPIDPKDVDTIVAYLVSIRGAK